MIDPLKAHVARLLRVADAEIVSAEHDKETDQYTVELRTGGKVLIDPSGVYALDDNIANKGLPKWIIQSEPGPEISKPEPEPEPEAGSDGVPDGTTNEVIVWVDGNKDRAAVALEAERERSKPRVALIKQLERIMDG